MSRQFFKALSALVAIVLGALPFATHAAKPGQYVGEICWKGYYDYWSSDPTHRIDIPDQFHEIYVDGGEFKFNFQATYSGGDQYALVGYMVDSAFASRRIPVTAVATLVENKFHIAVARQIRGGINTWSNSAEVWFFHTKHRDLIGDNLFLTVDASTLDGTVQANMGWEVYFDPASGGIKNFERGDRYDSLIELEYASGVVAQVPCR